MVRSTGANLRQHDPSARVRISLRTKMTGSVSFCCVHEGC